MNHKLFEAALIVAVASALCLLTVAPSLARASLDKPSRPAVPDSVAHDKKPKLKGEARRQAKNDYKVAKAKCQSNIGADRLACLNNAETVYRAAIGDAPARP